MGQTDRAGELSNWALHCGVDAQAAIDEGLDCLSEGACPLFLPRAQFVCRCMIKIAHGDGEEMARIVRPLLARYAILDASEGQDDAIKV